MQYLMFHDHCYIHQSIHVRLFLNHEETDASDTKRRKKNKRKYTNIYIDIYIHACMDSVDILNMSHVCVER